MSLCEVPAPSQDLIDTYNAHKSTFYNRLLNAYNKLHDAAAPVVQKFAESDRAQTTRDYIDEIQQKPEFQAFVKLAAWVFTEGTLQENTTNTR